MLAIVRLRYKVSMMWMVIIMYRQGLSGIRYRKKLSVMLRGEDLLKGLRAENAY
mgnify:CR=1 FL=1